MSKLFPPCYLLYLFAHLHNHPSIPSYRNIWWLFFYRVLFLYYCHMIKTKEKSFHSRRRKKAIHSHACTHSHTRTHGHAVNRCLEGTMRWNSNCHFQFWYSSASFALHLALNIGIILCRVDLFFFCFISQEGKISVCGLLRGCLCSYRILVMCLRFRPI